MPSQAQPAKAKETDRLQGTSLRHKILSTFRKRQILEYNQSDSPLFKLPAEVRLLIYQQILLDKVGGDGLTLYLRPAHGSIGNLMCRNEDMHEVGFERKNIRGKLLFVRKGHRLPDGMQASPGAWSLVLFMCTCKRVHSEALETLYTTYPVLLGSTTALLKLIPSFPIPKHQHKPPILTHLRSLHIHWYVGQLYALWRDRALSQVPIFDVYPGLAAWKKAWAIIAAMEALRELKVSLFSLSYETTSPAAVYEAKLFEPLMEVRHVLDFDLVVSWKKPAGRKTEWKGAPFRIERCPI